MLLQTERVRGDGLEEPGPTTRGRVRSGQGGVSHNTTATERGTELFQLQPPQLWIEILS